MLIATEQRHMAILIRMMLAIRVRTGKTLLEVTQVIILSAPRDVRELVEGFFAAAAAWATPRDDGTISVYCNRGARDGIDVLDIRVLVEDVFAVVAAAWDPPRNDRAISIYCSKGARSNVDVLGVRELVAPAKCSIEVKTQTKTNGSMQWTWIISRCR